MADTRRYLPVHQLDLVQILQEAQHRWLRPTEICEILRNYQRFGLTPEPPTRPPAGSLFLFDRKALRYFRKDGHRWRKKKDGKTVKEAHEKLKAGSVDVLHCYYAHGEDNENFQRRSYWMLDGQLEHIVFVHYREVKEGHKAGINHLLPDGGSQVRGPPNSSDTSFAPATSASVVRASHASSTDKVAGSKLTLSSDMDDVVSMNGPTPSMRNDPISWFSGGNSHIGTAVPISTDFHRSNSDTARDIRSHVGSKFYAVQSGVADFIAHKLTDARLDSDSRNLDVTRGNGSVFDPDSRAEAESLQEPSQVELEHDLATVCHQKVASSAVQIESGMQSGQKNEEAGELRKLDSFGRWMDKEIGRDCDNSLMASDSGNYWNALNPEHDNKEVSSLSHHMQLDTDSLGPSLSQEQLFSISDFAPDWAYSNVETKVLIIGTFLGSKKLSGNVGLGCMFGEIEVPAEILTDTSIKCVAPAHAPGLVPFYVTCSDRLACSEVREFEYRETPSTAVVIGPEEGPLQIRFAKLLSLSPRDQLFNCSVKGCDKCRLKDAFSMVNVGKCNGGRVKEVSTCIKAGHDSRTDVALLSLLKDRLCQWLFLKAHEGGKGPCTLDKEGQGVIHLAAALGYEWAIGPIIAAGVNPNFRDSHGRTALHWASYFGREEMVTTLVALGGSPGVVNDPTPTFPGGQTAADLASSQGHKGIAAYLAEADLTSHLSALTVDNDVIVGAATAIAVDEAADAAVGAVPSDMSRDEDFIMKGSLAAVRKSAHAAALIQSVFRLRSFRQRQLMKAENDAAEVSMDLVALGSLNKVRKISNFEDYLHSSAIKIQQKYRGWKGRKEFLKIRNRIIKVQAHVRGHQVRKQYKKVVWSVSIVEKAILRWRRKRVGLRAFSVEKKDGDPETLGSKADEYDYLRIGRKQKFEGVERALARVKSMVRDPKARDQYMRLVSKSDYHKMVSKGTSVLAQDGFEQRTDAQ